MTQEQSETATDFGRTLSDVINSGRGNKTYLYIEPSDFADGITRVRQASSIWLVEVFPEKGELLVSIQEGSDVESVVEAEGKDSVRLAYGGRWPADTYSIPQRADLAACDVERVTHE